MTDARATGNDPRSHASVRGVLVAAALLLVACGSETVTVPQAIASPLTEASVAFNQTGDARASIDKASVSYRLDDAGLLQVALTLHSTAASAQTVTVRGSLFSRDGRLVGDVTGGDINVPAGGTVQLHLSGPHPNGEIASGTYEVHVQPAST